LPPVRKAKFFLNQHNIELLNMKVVQPMDEPLGQGQALSLHGLPLQIMVGNDVMLNNNKPTMLADNQ